MDLAFIETKSGAKRFWVEPERGVSLEVSWFEGARANEDERKMLLITHWMDSRGWRGNASLYFTIIRAVQENGWDVIIYDQRGLGNSIGEFGYGKDESKDLEWLYRFVLQQFHPSQVVLLGHSLGGVPATRVSVKYQLPLILLATPANHHKNIFRGILRSSKSKNPAIVLALLYGTAILDLFLSVFGISKFERMVFGVPNRASKVVFELMRHRVARDLRRLHAPALYIHGNKDELVLMEDTFGFPIHVDMIELDGADHSFALFEDAVTRKIKSFLKTLTE